MLKNCWEVCHFLSQLFSSQFAACNAFMHIGDSAFSPRCPEACCSNCSFSEMSVLVLDLLIIVSYKEHGDMVCDHQLGLVSV